MKKSQTAKYALFGAVALGFIAIIMSFLPAIAVKDTDTTYNAWQVMFGYTETTKLLGSEVKTKVLEFSFLNLLAYLFIIGGVVLVALNAFTKKANKFFVFIACALFILAAVLVFMTVNLTVLPENAQKVLDMANKSHGDVYSLGVGAIIAGICSILAGCACVCNVLFNK